MILKIPKHIVYYLASVLDKSFKETFDLIIINANEHRDAAKATFARKKTQNTYARKFIISGLPDHMYLKVQLYSEWRNHSQLSDHMSISMPVIGGHMNINFDTRLDEAMYKLLEDKLMKDDGEE